MKTYIKMYRLCLVVTLVTLFVACSKDDGDNPIPTELVTNVYAVGEKLNGTSYLPTLWKNGEAQYLNDGSNEGYAYSVAVSGSDVYAVGEDRKSTRLNSSHVKISYAVFCLKKKK